MYTILLSGCLLLGLAAWYARNRWPRSSQLGIGLSVTGCLALTIWQTTQSLGSGKVQRSHRGQASVAYVLAHEFLAQTTRRTGEIILLFPPEKEAPVAALDSFYEGFARVMARFRGIKLREMTIPTTQKTYEEGRLDKEIFEKTLPMEPDILAYVSWVGFPNKGEAMSLFQQPKPPPFFVYMPNDTEHWQSAMDAGFIRAVARIKSSSKASAPQQEPDTPRQFFDSSYQLITNTKDSKQGAK
ncbi:MAG: hypothetical protein P8L18_11745 [Verrucomicrobiota bacterium]|nr:hypothetical protein [Verrucomicrobiota bacterium]